MMTNLLAHFFCFFLATCSFRVVESFSLKTNDYGSIVVKTTTSSKTRQFLSSSNENNEDEEPTRRREVISTMIGGSIVSAATTLPPANAAFFADFFADENEKIEIRDAIRPYAYRVDSTIPPVLLPLSSARQERGVLKQLGKGLGTTKKQVVTNRLNLNNIANKGVVGSINLVKSALGLNAEDNKRKGPGYASFVAMGVPYEPTTEDVGLVKNLVSTMLSGRDKNRATAMGLYFAPLSTQSALTSFIQSSGDIQSVIQALKQTGVSQTTIDLYEPLLQFAKSNQMDLIAMSPELEDIQTVRRSGLQDLNAERRSQYVVDSEGFIELTTAPKFRLYSSRSLLKDFIPQDSKDSSGNFFAERILVHEAGATALARYTQGKNDAFVTYVAPIADVRYVGGTNGRLPRVCNFLGKDLVTEECVTTILCNPKADETLSSGRRLRLEIGTAPDVLDYQTKISDFLWFSQMPKVYTIPRLMNG